LEANLPVNLQNNKLQVQVSVKVRPSALPSTDATCDSAPGPKHQNGNAGPSKDSITTMLASVHGCCGGTSHYLLFFLYLDL